MKKLLLAIGLVLGLTAPVGAQVIDSANITAADAATNCTIAGACAFFDPGSATAISLQFSGTFTASLLLEGTADGVNWVSINAINVATSVNGTSISGAGLMSFSNSGFIKVRVRCTSYTSGTVRVTATRGFATARLFAPVVTSVAFGDGSISAPSITFANESTLGIYRASATDLRFVAGGVDTFRLAGGGVILPAGSNIGFGATGITSVDATITRVGPAQFGISNLSGAGPAVINGTLTTNIASGCTVADTTETTLWTYSLPANALNANGRGVRITAWGTVGANADSKATKLYFGSTVIATRTSTDNDARWKMVGDVLRTAATTQLANGQFFIGGVGNGTFTGASFNLVQTTPAETLANAITIKVTGTNGTGVANDICLAGAYVETIK